MSALLYITTYLLVSRTTEAQQLSRNMGRLQEVFAWKQLTYDINGQSILQDRFGDIDADDNQNEFRRKREADESFVFKDPQDTNRRPWDKRPRPPSTTTRRPSSEANRFFIQYNNVPMGAERVGDRLFITVPRRRYGIPSTLNYIDLTQTSNQRSPPLRPYPNFSASRNLTSVYRTRADSCGRLWMVDTGLLEIPNNPQQVQPPAIVIYDLGTNRQILRYPFKSSDIPAANTPTGLASITVDIMDSCNDAYAYIPDLTTYGIIIYSLRDNDSWRVTHNYFHFDPTAGNLVIAGQRFQWSDGIFSITLTDPDSNGCRTAYFHPMVSTREFSVSTCVLRNRSSSTDDNYWAQYHEVGTRGANSQSTMHGYHVRTRVLFFAEIARDSLACWRTATPLVSENVAVLASDSQRMSYPADLHITGDEVWMLTNTLPRFGYSRLDTTQYNFFVYRGAVDELIAGTACEGSRLSNLG